MIDRKALAAAFPATIPVLMGYLAIGVAFGLMLQEIGYNFIWAFFMSLTIYAGSGQYLGVTLLSTCAGLGTVALMTLLINFRHLVYGLSMLEKFRGMGWRKLYMMFSLTDETYALLASAQAPVGVNPKNFYFAIALLDHSYWILGSVIGAVAGALIPIDTTGIDFAMTALFIVIAVEQWQTYRQHLPALLGAGATLLFLVGLGQFFGQQQMLLVSLGVIVLALLLLRERLEKNNYNVKNLREQIADLSDINVGSINSAIGELRKLDSALNGALGGIQGMDPALAGTLGLLLQVNSTNIRSHLEWDFHFFIG